MFPRLFLSLLLTGSSLWAADPPALPPTSTRPMLAPPVLPPSAPKSLPASPVTPSDFVQKRSGCLVLVHDEHGSGSGFIANFAGKIYLLTNAHVLAGTRQPVFTLLDGTRLTPISVEAAVGHDLVRLGLKDPPHDAIDVGLALEQNARLGDEVFVLGNSGGGGVVTALPGTIAGLGPDRLEVTSAFIPGNSGSPIIHAPTGRVIGIATYLTRSRDEFASGGKGSDPANMVVRRFGFRLDSVQTWQPVNFLGFQAEAAQVGKVEALTDDIIDFLTSLRTKKTPELATETLRRAATEWRQKVSNQRISEVDRRSATQSFLTSLRAMSRGDVVALERTLRYDYFRRELAKQREVRDQLYDSFNKEAQNLSSTSR